MRTYCTKLKESFYIRNEFNSLRVVLVHQHGGRFIVLEHQYGHRDIMWKRSITTSISYINRNSFSDLAWSMDLVIIGTFQKQASRRNYTPITMERERWKQVKTYLKPLVGIILFRSPAVFSWKQVKSRSAWMIVFTMVARSCYGSIRNSSVLHSHRH